MKETKQKLTKDNGTCDWILKHSMFFLLNLNIAGVHYANQRLEVLKIRVLKTMHWEGVSAFPGNLRLCSTACTQISKYIT